MKFYNNKAKELSNKTIKVIIQERGYGMKIAAYEQMMHELRAENEDLKNQLLKLTDANRIVFSEKSRLMASYLASKMNFEEVRKEYTELAEKYKKLKKKYKNLANFQKIKTKAEGFTTVYVNGKFYFYMYFENGNISKIEITKDFYMQLH